MESFIRHAIKRVYFCCIQLYFAFMAVKKFMNLLAWICSCWNTKRCEIVFLHVLPENFSLLFRHSMPDKKVFLSFSHPSMHKTRRNGENEIKMFRKLKINKVQTWSYLHDCRTNWQLQLMIKRKLHSTRHTMPGVIMQKVLCEITKVANSELET